MSSQIAQSREPFFKAPRQFKQRGPNGFPIGPRQIERHKQNAKLNKLPDSVKKVCELRIPGVCAGNRMLTWCHYAKSRFLLTNRDWQTAARGCLPCHQHIEALSHKEMARIVTEAIERRRGN